MSLDLPVFPFYYANLHSSFIKTENLLAFLEQEEFTGFLEFRVLNSEQRWIIFLENGLFLSCLTVMQGEIKKGSRLEVLELDDFILNISKLPLDEVLFWSRLLLAQKKYTDLSSDFIDVVKFINKLRQEQLNGVLECVEEKTEQTYYVYFWLGNILGIASKKYGYQLMRDKKVMDEMVLAQAKFTFNVYEVNLKDVDSEVEEESMHSLKTGLELILNYLAQHHSDLNLTLRKVCLAGSKQFIFLDPFAEEFEYKNGKLFVENTINFNELLAASNYILERLFSIYKLGKKEKQNIILLLKDKNIDYNYFPCLK